MSVLAPVRERHGLQKVARATLYLGARELRSAVRTPAAFLPNLLMPIFFFFMMSGALSGFASRSGVTNYRAFQLPLSMLFAVSSGGAGLNTVTDIETGYFDKLLLTPASRLSILVGAMGADFVRILLQGALVTAIVLAAGTDFATGAPGAALFILMASVWGLAWSAIGFALALKTGSSQATQGVFAFFFPLIFLSTAVAPIEALEGWLRTAATYNPITYVLRGLRSLAMTGWNGGEIAIGLAAIGGVGLITISLALRALQSRVR